jgi:hypothetical protein
VLIAHPLIHDRQFLVPEVHGAALLTPPDVAGPAALARIPRPGQGLDLPLQHVAHRLQAQRNKRLNHRHPRAKILGQFPCLPPADKLYLALSATP